MKRTLQMTLLIPLLALFAAPAAKAEALISVNLGDPGYYGPIELDDLYPAPHLLFPDPVVIDEAYRHGRPLYLHVPPGHAKDWSKHCKHYNACDRPAYFVQDNWYADTYIPAYREHHGGKGKNKGQGNNSQGNSGQGNNGQGNNGQGNNGQGNNSQGNNGQRNDRD